jgi:NAD(P)-dependent dehydrogenase (short-subunit alcohol dehydrogenase family)
MEYSYYLFVVLGFLAVFLFLEGIYSAWDAYKGPEARRIEKRLQALNAKQMLRQLEVNAVGPALLIKHFLPLLLTQGAACYATLSARVGSIEDNHKGGWYGYRAAKAARNMLLQTAAIEAARQKPLAVFAALQPGTVQSNLSAQFVAAQDALMPQDSVAQLMQVLGKLRPTGRAQFVDYAGHEIPW